MSAIRRLVVGVDGSEGSRQAVGFAARLATGLGAEVVVVRAYSPLDDLLDGSHPQGAAPGALRDAAAADLAGPMCAALTAAGVVHTSRLLEDEPPHEVLARACADEGADLLVVGSHGHTGWRERIVGSVTTKLLSVAPCPVVVVPQRTTAG